MLRNYLPFNPRFCQQDYKGIQPIPRDSVRDNYRVIRRTRTRVVDYGLIGIIF